MKQCVQVVNRNGQVVQSFEEAPEVLFMGIETEEESITHFVKKDRVKEEEPTFFQVDLNGVRSEDSLLAQVFAPIQFDPRIREGGGIIKEFQGHFWIFSEESFLVLPKDGQAPIDLLQKHPQLRWSTDLFFDQNQSAWVSTQFGLYKIELQPSLFKRNLHQKIEEGFPENFACRSIQMDTRGNLWVIVENQEWLWKINSSEATEKAVFPVGGTRYALGKNKDGLLLFYYDDHINVFDPITEKGIKKISLKDHLKPMPYIWTIHEDRQGQIWTDGVYDGNSIGQEDKSPLKVMTKAPGGLR